MTQGSNQRNTLKFISKKSLRVLGQDCIYCGQPWKRDILNKYSKCSGRPKDTEVVP